MAIVRRFGFIALSLICTLGLVVAPAFAQDTASTATGPSYPDSAAGWQAQFADLTRIARTNDRAAFQAGLNSLGIPDAAAWFNANFDPRFEAQLLRDYAKTISGYQSHVSWVMGNFAKFDDFALRVEPSETPEPLRDSGFESLLPRPKRRDQYRELSPHFGLRNCKTRPSIGGQFVRLYRR